MDILDILLDILLKPPQPFIGLFFQLYVLLQDNLLFACEKCTVVNSSLPLRNNRYTDSYAYEQLKDIPQFMQYWKGSTLKTFRIHRLYYVVCDIQPTDEDASVP